MNGPARPILPCSKVAQATDNFLFLPLSSFSKRRQNGGHWTGPLANLGICSSSLGRSEFEV